MEERHGTVEFVIPGLGLLPPEEQEKALVAIFLATFGSAIRAKAPDVRDEDMVPRRPIGHGRGRRVWVPDLEKMSKLLQDVGETDDVEVVIPDDVQGMISALAAEIRSRGFDVRADGTGVDPGCPRYSAIRQQVNPPRGKETPPPVDLLRQPRLEELHESARPAALRELATATIVAVAKKNGPSITPDSVELPEERDALEAILEAAKVEGVALDLPDIRPHPLARIEAKIGATMNENDPVVMTGQTPNGFSRRTAKWLRAHGLGYWVEAKKRPVEIRAYRVGREAARRTEASRNRAIVGDPNGASMLLVERIF